MRKQGGREAHDLYLYSPQAKNVFYIFKRLERRRSRICNKDCMQPENV